MMHRHQAHSIFESVVTRVLAPTIAATAILLIISAVIGPV